MVGREQSERAAIAKAEESRAMIARLLLRGNTAGEISQILKLDALYVRSEETAIRKAWRDSVIRDSAELRDGLLRKIEDLCNQAQAGYEASKQDEVTVVHEQEADAEDDRNDGFDGQMPHRKSAEGFRRSNSALPVTKIKTMVRSRPEGNVAFLAEINRAIKSIRELLGTDAATKSLHVTAAVADFTPEERRAMMEDPETRELLVKLEERASEVKARNRALPPAEADAEGNS